MGNTLSLRTTLTRGQGPRGLAPPVTEDPALLLTMSKAPDRQKMMPLSLIISQKTRRNDYSPLSRLKTLNYGDEVLAIQEAKNKGADNAILLNTRDELTCATNGNIYIQLDGNWLTPPLSSGVLNGTIRQKLLEEKIVQEARVLYSDLNDISAMAYSNALTGIIPVAALEQKKMDSEAFRSCFGDRDWALED